ncbi:GNAT family N-acetyltransferase [Flavihumibacter fluvii]|uniref:GNAT family N-acetyltransferase n=1 Tax=Flavihumibacter fluvii TaxID=2838157 RepID=UPI001BDEA134|nr:GNAT family N-acetyltransferase [Flavihumibacter fluvii]ULQ51839.1 GNAT family N-acetyltransferase [Flavihumibacter fluvii]
MSILSKFNFRIKQYGFTNLMRILVKKTLQKPGYFHDEYILYQTDLRNGPPPLRQLPPGFTNRQLELKDFIQSAIIEFEPAKIDLYKRRLDSGNYLAYGIFKEQHLVYYFWLSLKEVELPEHMAEKSTLEVGPDEGYLADGYCHPDYRGQGFHGYMGSFLMHLISKMGRHYATTIIMKENRAARKSQEKIGFTPLTKIEFKGFGKHARFITSPY